MYPISLALLARAGVLTHTRQVTDVDKADDKNEQPLRAEICAEE